MCVMSSKKMAIAMFGQKRLSREGGIEIVVKELCTRMAKNGYTVTCYNRSGHHVSGAEYDKKTEYEGINQKCVPTIEKKGLAAVSSSFFAALYSAFGKYNVVHIHAEGPAFFSWLPKLLGKRVIVTVHGLDWQREKWKSGFGSKFIKQGEKNAVKYADEIIVLSKGVHDYFRNQYGRETRFIPNGVNRPEIRKAELITDKFGLTKDSYILFLGRLVPEKGIRYLIEAFKNVKTEKKLVIAGGSSDTDSFMKELKELAKDDKRIIFTGFVQGMLVIAAGLYKETRVQSTVQAAILLIGGICFGIKWGLAGIMLASCLSNLYRCIDLYFFIPKMVTHMTRKSTLLNICTAILMIIVIYVTAPRLIKFTPTSLITWFVYAICVGIYSLVFICIFHIIFARDNFRTILIRLRNMKGK